MNRSTLSPWTLRLLMTVGITAISFSSLFVRWSDAPASVLGMYRLLLTNVLMLPFMLGRWEELKRIGLRDAAWLGLSGLFLALHFLFWMESLRYTSVASSTVLLTLEPIFVLFGSWLLHREKVTRTALLGIVIAFTGVLAMGWGDIGLSARAVWGDVLSLIGTFAVAVHMLLGKRLRRTISSTVYSFVVFLAAGFVFFCYNWAMAVPMTGYPPKEWGLFLLLAVVPTVFGHILFNWMLRYVRAATVSMSVLGEPVGASLLAFALLDEPLTALQAASASVMLLGVWLFIREESAQG